MDAQVEYERTRKAKTVWRERRNTGIQKGKPSRKEPSELKHLSSLRKINQTRFRKQWRAKAKKENCFFRKDLKSDETEAIEGVSPVKSKKKLILKSVGEVIIHRTSGYHPRISKYVIRTDSGQVPRGKGEKNPEKGSEIEPEMRSLQAVGVF